MRDKKPSVEKPQHLVQSISPYKVLDGIFKPLYVLVVQHATQTRNVILTAISLRRMNLRKIQIERQSSDDYLMSKRRHFQVLLEKEVDEEHQSEGIFVGTANGECGVIYWEGYEFSTGISLNKEVCKWVWRKQIHDGPVSHIVRSRHLKDVLLTVGGRIFAVWREDVSEPILWRKSEFRYTACCWDISKPTVMILGRSDGTVEIWDVFNKSHEPNITQSLSGRIITGIYAHELPLNPPCVGFCDYNGALRTFLAPKLLFASNGESDVKWMRQFVDREVNRIKDFKTWQESWNNMTTPDQSEKKSRLSVAEKDSKHSEPENLVKVEATKTEIKGSRVVKEHKKVIDAMQARWVHRELERMQTTLLEKKGLRGKELERQREPQLRMKQEARNKDVRRQAVMVRATELFEDAVVSNFPQESQKLLTAAAAVSKTAKKWAASSGDLNSLNAVQAEDPQNVEVSDEQTIRAYEKIEVVALQAMKRKSHELYFSWRKLIKEGLQRRKSMDVNLKMHQLKRGEDFSKQQSESNPSSRESFEDDSRMSFRE